MYHISPSRKIALSFFLIIVAGSILLYLPWLQQPGQHVSFLDCFFTATSATCVTGLSSVTIATAFNNWGHLVIMLLIQFGGLGFMTIMAGFILLLKNRISLTQQLAVRDLLNRRGLFNINSFLKEIVLITIFIESFGAVFMSIALIPQFGILHGIWQAVFLAVSAFCNAGFDILGSTSLIAYRNNWLICGIVMLLITIGGIGFAVWYDIKEYYANLRLRRQKELPRRAWQSLSTHSQIALIASAVLIVLPALLILLQEATNPKTLAGETYVGKILQALFQSVTLRTAGFASVDIGSLTSATKLLMLPVMFIGGSPGGTAGGIKTTTAVLIFCFIISLIKNRAHVSIFKRTIPTALLHKSLAVGGISVVFLSISIYLLSLTETAPIFDLAFEAVSALATVGLSTGITATLSGWGKLIIIILMFAGRIGIVTLIFSLIDPSEVVSRRQYPSGHVLVG